MTAMRTPPAAAGSQPPTDAPATASIPTAYHDMMTVAQVCRCVPGARGNDRLNPATVTRWILRGCPARTGERVRLRAVRLGGRWLIEPATLAEFTAALAGSMTTVPRPPAGPAAAAMTSASARAARELSRRGA